MNFDTLLSQEVPLILPRAIIEEYQFDDWTHCEVAPLIKQPTESKEKNPVLKEGVLLKRNEFYWKQERLFVLSWDGLLKYFDMDIKQKGTIKMTS